MRCLLCLCSADMEIVNTELGLVQGTNVKGYRGQMYRVKD